MVLQFKSKSNGHLLQDAPLDKFLLIVSHVIITIQWNTHTMVLLFKLLKQRNGHQLQDALPDKFQLTHSHATITTLWSTHMMEQLSKLLKLKNGLQSQDAPPDKSPLILSHATTTTTWSTHMMVPQFKPYQKQDQKLNVLIQFMETQLLVTGMILIHKMDNHWQKMLLVSHHKRLLKVAQML